MRVNIYIRNEDMPLWDALTDKPTFIHNALHQSGASVYTHTPKDVSIHTSDKPITVAPERLDNGLCKVHGTPLTRQGKCMQKGCKYA